MKSKQVKPKVWLMWQPGSDETGPGTNFPSPATMSSLASSHLLLMLDLMCAPVVDAAYPLGSLSRHLCST